MMRFRDIHDPVVSADGAWIAYQVSPDRGDGEVRIQSTADARILRVERGSHPEFSDDSRWVGVQVEPPLAETEGKPAKDAPKRGFALVSLPSGETFAAQRVERFAFSKDSAWLAYQRFAEEAKEDKEEKKSDEAASKPKSKPGAELVLRRLSDGSEQSLPLVSAFAFDPESAHLAYVRRGADGVGNGLFRRDLRGDATLEKPILAEDLGLYENLAWTRQGGRLAFLASRQTEDDPAPAALRVWHGSEDRLTEPSTESAAGEGWRIPLKNQLEWTRDGQRLYFGVKPEPEPKKKRDAKPSEPLLDIDTILEKRELDVWHWNDPRIKPQEKKEYATLRDWTYRSVHHLESDRSIRLADPAMPRLDVSENPNAALGRSEVPYLKEGTWGESYEDFYRVDLQTGERSLIVARLDGRAHLSPEGRYAVYFKDDHWHLYDARDGSTKNLTESLGVPFRDEDHDYPGPAPGYQCEGWVGDDQAVLIRDKYDVWEFFTDGRPPLDLTDGVGRGEKTVFRVVKTDPEQLRFEPGQSLLLSGYRDLRKNDGFWEAREGVAGVRKLLEENVRFRFKSKAKDADVTLFTRESYSEFPDLWVADGAFQSPRRISDANPEMDRFAWGSAEMVEWNSLDGIPLQGVLIKPGNYEPGKRYPVIVYFYRFFSQRLHEFNEVVVNHRPCFPFYASNGYAIFLPDIRFEVGRPGLSSLKSLLPGVQKLVDMGVADPKALGIHGHSWSGYQTAYIITQTNLFAAAVAGAPVANMTSAYSGIRLGSGRARQFQYEEAQSRIGGSLWEFPERYIENSPLFFADRIQTPLLIEFGDEDDAVPWQQGVELYLAMRRLGKECVFLQYRGEPHHLKKYPNKLDYSIKMKEYFDHYLKGAPAPKWMTEGVAYQGK